MKKKMTIMIKIMSRKTIRNLIMMRMMGRMFKATMMGRLEGTIETR